MATISANDNIVTVNICFSDFIVDIKRGVCKYLEIPLDLMKNNFKCKGNRLSASGDSDYHTVIKRYCSALSNCGKWYATITKQNKLLLWNVITWTIISVRDVERSGSKMTFTPSSNYIIIADKTGDVYSYSVIEPLQKGVLILGHISVILDVLITPDEKFIITCDRDEKVRVSHFPNAYNICSFCLGHSEFVIACSVMDKNTIISASGDGTLRLWNYRTGEELACHSVSQDSIINLNIRKACESSEQYNMSDYVITHMSCVYKVEEFLLFCVSISGHSKLFIYNATTAPPSVSCIQTITLYSEPLTFTLTNTGYLWILVPSQVDKSKPSIEALRFYNNQFNKFTNENIQNGINSANNLLENSMSDQCDSFHNILSGLYKKPKLLPEKFKKI